jgi:very-short-patch-repair endonuclease
MRQPDRWRGPDQVRRAAKELRQPMTVAEQKLWSAVRRNGIDGLHFRRQHPVGPFILDFYCPRAKLAVELDGAIHDRQVARDLARTEGLETLGIRVLRFRNEAVLNELAHVTARIAQEPAARLGSAPPSPAERVEGGWGGGGLSPAPGHGER